MGRATGYARCDIFEISVPIGVAKADSDPLGDGAGRGVAIFSCGCTFDPVVAGRFSACDPIRQKEGGAAQHENGDKSERCFRARTPFDKLRVPPLKGRLSVASLTRRTQFY